jgi:protein-L-isoaspartate(D-aspartate) O-methyltransferase
MKNNYQLVKYLVANGSLRSEEIINAFLAVDRRDFVGLENVENAYGDYALSIGYGATISQPTTVAFMLERLKVMPGNIVLDVGAGSAWTTALLAQIVGEKGKVYGVEIIAELVTFGQRNLDKYKLSNVSLEQAGDKLGSPANAPFNRILVSAGTNDVPTELISQLEEGGTLVIPIDAAIWQIKKVSDSSTDIHKYPGFMFVPLQTIEKHKLL